VIARSPLGLGTVAFWRLLFLETRLIPSVYFYAWTRSVVSKGSDLGGCFLTYSSNMPITNSTVVRFRFSLRSCVRPCVTSRHAYCHASIDGTVSVIVPSPGVPSGYGRRRPG
jgi:hypothetical protein